MKKVIMFTFLFSVFFYSLCVAQTKNVIGHVTSDRTILYEVTESKSARGLYCGICFAKNVDGNGDSEYWLKVVYTSEDDILMPYIILIIDGNEYQLSALNKLERRHIQSGITANTDFYTYNAFSNCYPIPKNVVEALKNSHSIIFQPDRQKCVGVKLDMGERYMGNLKKIIELTYQDKTGYWKPKIIE